MYARYSFRLFVVRKSKSVYVKRLEAMICVECRVWNIMIVVIDIQSEREIESQSAGPQTDVKVINLKHYELWSGLVWSGLFLVFLLFSVALNRITLISNDDTQEKKKKPKKENDEPFYYSWLSSKQTKLKVSFVDCKFDFCIK